MEVSNMDCKRINILGCCVSRDSIEFNREKYIVPRYAAFVSPWSMFSGKCEIPDWKIFQNDVSPFTLKCLEHDAKLSTIDYLKEEKADWLLLDFADCRLNIVEWTAKGISLSYSNIVKNNFNSFVEAFGNDYKTIKAYDLPWDEFIGRIDYLLEQLLNIYPAEKIILHEFYCADMFIDKHRNLQKVKFAWMKEYVERANPLFQKIYTHCEQKLEKSHIIRCPENVVADEINKWGLHNLHYHRLYYEYAEKAISVITRGFDRSTEEYRLATLRELYSEKFATLREKALCNSVRTDRDKWRSYSDTFKSLVVKKLLLPDSDICIPLLSAILRKGYQHIAIYGDTEITKVLCNILVGTVVTIDYIVENGDKPIQGIKTVNRNLTQYPNCDLMLIADIASWPDIKAKLEKMKVPFPFYNAAEFIQSLPSGDSESVDNTKKRINSLSEQLSASVKNEAKLTEQLNDLTKQEIASKKTIDKLNSDINLISNDKNKILAEKQKVVSERDVALSERDAANSEIQAIRNSISFKIGRGLTLIPRKIRDFIKAKKK